jgi:hypothetical protein
MRDMFASMLMFCEVTNPKQLWDAHWESLSDDIEVVHTARVVIQLLPFLRMR